MKKTVLSEGAHGIMFRLLRDPVAVLLARQAGLDFVMLDFEHGPHDFHDLAAMSAVGRSVGLSVLIRVPELSRGYVSRALDCGAGGIMCPMIESPEQARQLVAWSKYDPLGQRGLSSVGGHSNYARVAEPSRDMPAMNRSTLTIAQVETRAGVEAVEEIASVEGIDAIVVGPNDLAVSLGVVGELTHPKVCSAVERIAAAANSNRRMFGMHAGFEYLSRWTSLNLRLIINSLDIDLLASGFQALAGQNQRLEQRAMEER